MARPSGNGRVSGTKNPQLEQSRAWQKRFSQGFCHNSFVSKHSAATVGQRDTRLSAGVICSALDSTKIIEAMQIIYYDVHGLPGGTNIRKVLWWYRRLTRGHSSTVSRQYCTCVRHLRFRKIFDGMSNCQTLHFAHN